MLRKNRTYILSPESFSLFIFIVVGLFAAFHHSLWRDEMQGWLVAWKSDSWTSLWVNNAPSGHPVLWSALIYSVKGLTNTPLSMQLLHWLLGSLALFVFWRWNPLPKWQKVIFTFGYFPFWEYYLICRHYVLAELLIFLFCSFFHYRRKSYILSSVLIGLLFNTHAFSWSLGFAACVVLCVEWFTDSQQRKTYKNQKYWSFDLAISLIILVSLALFAAFSLIQVKESVDFISGPLDLRHAFRVLGRLFGGYFLIIPNSDQWLDLILCSLIICGALVITVSFLRRSNAALIFFLSGITFLLLFNYNLYLGIGSRHYGYYYLILISSVWLSLHPEEQINKINNKIFNIDISKVFNALLTFCLAIHFAAGVHRTLYDFYVPYSAGKETANYIKEMGWSEQVMFGTRDVEVTTVSGYLDRDIFYPELNSFGSYAQWNKRKSVNRSETLTHIQSFFVKYPETNRLLVILSKGSAFSEMRPGDKKSYGSLSITADKKFERSWVNPERFYLYWVVNAGNDSVDVESIPRQNE